MIYGRLAHNRRLQLGGAKMSTWCHLERRYLIWDFTYDVGTYDRSRRGPCSRHLGANLRLSSRQSPTSKVRTDMSRQPTAAAAPYLDTPRSPLLFDSVAAPPPPCNGGNLGGRFVLPLCDAVLPAADGRLDDNDGPLLLCFRRPVRGTHTEAALRPVKPQSSSWCGGRQDYL